MTTETFRQDRTAEGHVPSLWADVARYCTHTSVVLTFCAISGIALLAFIPSHEKPPGSGGGARSTKVENIPVRPQPLVTAPPLPAPQGKPPAAKTADTQDKQPAAKAAEQPPAAAPPAVPTPDVWPDAEIITALQNCIRLLSPLGADVEISPPEKKGQCGTPAPVLVRRIGAGTPVDVRPAATLNCQMIAALHKWVEKTLQPAAQAELNSPVASIQGASGYICRNRNHDAAAPLSHHAFANAVDIGGFTLADGRTITVAGHWGPTARGQRKAAAAAEAKGAAKTDKAAAKKAAKKRVKKAEPSNLGAAPAPEAAAAPAATPESTFLRRLHKGACEVFGT
ncbi:MAG: extensin family protein, partial [Hyphomicrobiaceae bacterium]